MIILTVIRNYVICRILLIIATIVGMLMIAKLILQPSILQIQLVVIISIFVLPATMFFAVRRFDKNIIYPELGLKMQPWPIWLWIIVIAIYTWSITLKVGWYLYYLYPIIGICTYSIIDIYANTEDLMKGAK